ncbi:MAG: hypothetical protein KAT90_13610 [Gammaproteobacteria bacterium]|nr:hypothetical protein [Gammaproteobacteria bacterium]
MTKPKSPNWSPTIVISEWKEKLEEANSWLAKFPSLEVDTTEADMYYRLLTYEDMQSVWKRLPKYDISPELFSSMVALAAIYRKNTPSNLAPKEYEDWLDNVRTTAQRLAKLIEFSGFDQIINESYYTKRSKYLLANIAQHAFKGLDPDVSVNATYEREPESERWPDLNPGLLSATLQRLARMESDDDVGMHGIKHDSVRLEKPNHRNAERSYFIKYLTKMLRDKTGKPLRDIVTKTTATVFDDPSISERQIFRIAP